MTEKHSDKLKTRTVQIVGFGFATVLTLEKLFIGNADIPWIIVIAFFGYGSSAEIDFLRQFTDIFGGKK